MSKASEVVAKYSNAVRTCQACSARSDAFGAPVPCQVPLMSVDAGRPVPVLAVAPTPTVTLKWGGVVYSGGARRMLDQFFKHAGLVPEENVALSYLIHCSVRPDAGLLAEQVSACNRFLRAEIVLLRPRLVLGIGAPVVASLSGGLKLSEAMAQGVLELPAHPGVSLVALPSPALALASPKVRTALFSQAALVPQFLEENR